MDKAICANKHGERVTGGIAYGLFGSEGDLGFLCQVDLLPPSNVKLPILIRRSFDEEDVLIGRCFVDQ